MHHQQLVQENAQVVATEVHQGITTRGQKLLIQEIQSLLADPPSDYQLNFLKENLTFNGWTLNLRDSSNGFFHENGLKE